VAWTEGSGGRLCVEEVPSGAWLRIHRAGTKAAFAHVDSDPQAPHVGLQVGHDAWVVPHIDNRQDTAAISAHEFGHALGFGHPPAGTPSVMLAEGGHLRDGGLLWPLDRRRYCEAYGCRCLAQ
jgi:hypothetical protein